MQTESSKQCSISKTLYDQPTERLELIRRWPSMKAKQWVKAFVHAACYDTSLSAVVLLGSAVRPVKKINDVDVLYIYYDEGIKCPGRSIDVDLRAYSQEDIRSLLAEGNELVGWALRFGYLICEKNNYWTSLRNEWLNRLPFPDPETAKERARKAYNMYQRLRGIGDIDAAKEQFLSGLTHESRARLLSEGIYPKSRPELPDQLRDIGEHKLAQSLSRALTEREEEELITR